MTDEQNPTETEAPAPEESEAPVKGSDAELNQRRDANLEATATQGVLHDDGLLDRDGKGYQANATVTEAAPKDFDKDPASSVDGNPDYVPDPPATIADQKAPRFDKDAPEYRKGYVGTLPPGPGPDGEREDLTLAAAAERAREQYGDGTPDADPES